jgi:hypothetical protein
MAGCARRPEGDDIGARPHRHFPVNLFDIGAAPLSAARLGYNDRAGIAKLGEEAQRLWPPARRAARTRRRPGEENRGAARVGQVFQGVNGGPWRFISLVVRGQTSTAQLAVAEVGIIAADATARIAHGDRHSRRGTPAEASRRTGHSSGICLSCLHFVVMYCACGDRHDRDGY